MHFEVVEKPRHRATLVSDCAPAQWSQSGNANGGEYDILLEARALYALRRSMVRPLCAADIRAHLTYLSLELQSGHSRGQRFLSGVRQLMVCASRGSSALVGTFSHANTPL
ncbi:MAG: hypothetical protein ACI8W7_002206 [Gammaproteobacteria bacterium]|jgi:hypothetical protein